MDKKGSASSSTLDEKIVKARGEKEKKLPALSIENQDKAGSSSSALKRSVTKADLSSHRDDEKRRCETGPDSTPSSSKQAATVRDIRRIADETGERYQRTCCSCREELEIMKNRVDFWRNMAKKLGNAASELEQNLMTLKTSRDPNFKRKQRTVSTNTPVVTLPAAAFPNAFPRRICPNAIAAANQKVAPQQQLNAVPQQQPSRPLLPTPILPLPGGVRSPQQFGATSRFPVPGVTAFNGPRNPVPTPRGIGLPMRPMNGRGSASQAVQNLMRPQIQTPNSIARAVRTPGGQQNNGYQNGSMNAMNSPSPVRMQASRPLPVALVPPNAGNQTCPSVGPSEVVDLCSDDEDDLLSGSGNRVPQRQPLVSLPILPSSQHMNGNGPIARDGVPPFPGQGILDRMMNAMTPQLKLEVRSLELARGKGRLTLAWVILDSSRPRDLSMVANYELFSCQKVGAIVSDWNLIRSMNALNLPMACVVTLVRNGHSRKFHFTVRAVFKDGRKGPYCDYRSIEI